MPQATTTSTGAPSVITFSKIPEIDAVLINRPELPYTGAGERSIVPLRRLETPFLTCSARASGWFPLTPERALNGMNGKG